MKSKWFKVEIIKHTPLLFGNEYCDAFHKDMIGQNIVVRKTEWDGAYYECKTGESIIKSDCKIIKR